MVTRRKRTTSLGPAAPCVMHGRVTDTVWLDGGRWLSRCSLCGAVVPLGPADETTDPNVAIEIRAAEIAASGIGPVAIRSHEFDGWAHHYGRPMPPAHPIASPTTKGQLAGWLARQIAKGD